MYGPLGQEHLFTHYYERILAIELVPEWHETEYTNPKYIGYLSVTFSKYSRNGPRFVNLEVETLSGAGNNMSLGVALYEYLGGHYIPTPIQGEMMFCDFLLKEPFLGQMYYKQLPPNLTCPFPPGDYHLMNLTINLDNFPYNIPFTYSSLIVKIRLDIEGFITANRSDIVFRWKTFDKLTQSIKNGNKKKKPKKQGLQLIGMDNV